MTLLPSNEFGIRGHEGKPYDVNPMCAAPHCTQRSAHAHHMWSRSYLRGQPYEFVQLPDSTVIGNRIGLCQRHHEMVTGEIGGYRARIRFALGLFLWDERDHNDIWNANGYLYPQPPGAEQKIVEALHDDAAANAAPDEVCPTCGTHKRKKPPMPPTEKRKTKTWTVAVPDDAEIGGDVLDGWVDDFAVLFGFDDESSRLRRYHALALVLAWAVQHRDELLDDIREAATA
jgi:hypothetical protein